MYPGEYSSIFYPQHVCDICLRTEAEKATRKGSLDSGVFGGDHHACDIQGPFYAAMITGNI